MISEIFDYMSTWPMWLQAIIILGVFWVIVGFVIAIIYKVVKAEKIHVGPVDIEDKEEKPAEKEIGK